MLKKLLFLTLLPINSLLAVDWSIKLDLKVQSIMDPYILLYPTFTSVTGLPCFGYEYISSYDVLFVDGLDWRFVKIFAIAWDDYISSFAGQAFGMEKNNVYHLVDIGICFTTIYSYYFEMFWQQLNYKDNPSAL